MRWTTALHRALRRRCPRCGRGDIFAGWFRMLPRCAECGLPFEREPGYFLGSIYFNYGVTALLVMVGYLAGFLYGVPDRWLLAGLTVVCFGFPLWFFRHARALWLAFDHYFDRSASEEPRQRTG